MNNSYTSPVVAFDAVVPPEFLEYSVRSLLDCYRRGDEKSRSEYPREVAHDLRPILRRAEFEREWPLVVQNFPEMWAEYQQNHAKNCYHALIHCGNVILTQSFVDPRCGTVRSAIFRETYARRNDAFLFADMAPPAPRPDAPLYAILMHDADPKDQSRPNLIHIVFPDQDSKIVARIDLMERFSYLFNDAEFAEVERVEDGDLDIGLRPDAGQERKSV